jgi:hypothetical protein
LNVSGVVINGYHGQLINQSGVLSVIARTGIRKGRDNDDYNSSHDQKIKTSEVIFREEHQALITIYSKQEVTGELAPPADDKRIA